MTGRDELSIEEFLEVLREVGRPFATTEEVAARLDRPPSTVAIELESLADDPAATIETRELFDGVTVWYPAASIDELDPERVVVFPDRRELVVHRPSQFTRATLTQFAHLVATSGSEGYLYRIRPVDIWQAPYDDLSGLLEAIRGVAGALAPRLEEWIEDQWGRAHQFRLETHPDGYTVLVAETANVMESVARQELTEDELRADISPTESWVAEEAIASIKRQLYDAGFPVLDNRILEEGDPLSFNVEVEFRPYQMTWIDRFFERGSGVLVGPPGSGKTVAALGIMERVGGETLILVPSRELARQWRDRIVADTDLSTEDVGEYHGGTKQLRPVTVATYHIASMDRHRGVFEDRRWGLIVFDEVHHIPASVHRRTADLQSRARLGLSASPVRGDEREDEIFTLIGPPIGTDWASLLEAGYVVEPTLEIRYLPWGSDDALDAYRGASGHERRQRAALNPAKMDDIRRLLERHAEDRVLIFVDWLDHGRALSEELDVPFISGETPHAQRERYFSDVREGRLDTVVVSRVADEGIDLPDASVAILASGLGGSRRQGTQRVGRTMRPVGGAQVYVLATRGTEEEDFARQQLRHLQSKGLQVRETTVELATTGEAEQQR